MRVLLIHPVVRENALPANLPLGLAYTAAALKVGGIPCHVLDLNMARLSCRNLDWLVRETFRAGEFTHVGISAIASQFSRVEHLVGLLKSLDAQAPVIVGGPISVLGAKLHEWLGVSVYQGESDVQFAPYLMAAQYRDPVFVATEPVDPDTLYPAWKSFSDKYFQYPVGWLNKNKWRGGGPAGDVPRSINMVWARGCPYKCRFCSHCGAGQPYRKRSPVQIVREIGMLVSKYQTRHVHTSDDLTLLDKAWLQEVCGEIKRWAPSLTWGCAGRADQIDPDTLAMMHDAGCRLVGVGVESGSQRMLDEYNKKTTVEDNERAILACREVFGAADFSVMVGGPGEDEASVQETIDLCKRTGSRPEAVFYTTPLPGAEIYDEALGHGLIPDERAYLRGLGEMGEHIACNVSGQSDEWLVAARNKMLFETADLESAL